MGLSAGTRRRWMFLVGYSLCSTPPRWSGLWLFDWLSIFFFDPFGVKYHLLLIIHPAYSANWRVVFWHRFKCYFCTTALRSKKYKFYISRSSSLLRQSRRGSLGVVVYRGQEIFKISREDFIFPFLLFSLILILCNFLAVKLGKPLQTPYIKMFETYI
jgi:hypothetical protein